MGINRLTVWRWLFPITDLSWICIFALWFKFLLGKWHRWLISRSGHLNTSAHCVLGWELPRKKKKKHTKALARTMHYSHGGDRARSALAVAPWPEGVPCQQRQGSWLSCAPLELHQKDPIPPIKDRAGGLAWCHMTYTLHQNKRVHVESETKNDVLIQGDRPGMGHEELISLEGHVPGLWPILPRDQGCGGDGLENCRQEMLLPTGLVLVTFHLRFTLYKTIPFLSNLNWGGSQTEVNAISLITLT